MDRRAAARARSRSIDGISAILLIGHAIAWVAVLAALPSRALADDIARFVHIAGAPGRLYRDVPVEYMPVEAVLVRWFLDVSLEQAAIRVVAISAVGDIGAYLLVARMFGVRAGRTYLALALPLQVFMAFRLDMVAVVLVLGATALWRRKKAGSGGAVYATAILFKLWPLAVVPLLVRQGGRRAVIVAGGILVAGSAVWWAAAGADGIRYVLSFRGATGWQIESTVGSVIALFGREPPRFELGAIRVGEMGWLFLMALRVLTLLVLVAVWVKATRRPDVDPAGFPAAAAVATVIALAPVASAQYVAWIVPFAAIAVAERRRAIVLLAAAGASILAASSFLVYWDIAGGVRALEVISAARAVCIASIPIAWLLERSE